MVKLLMTHIIIYSHFSKIFEEGLLKVVNLLVISLELKMCKIRMEEMQNKLFLGKNSSLVWLKWDQQILNIMKKNYISFWTWKLTENSSILTNL